MTPTPFIKTPKPGNVVKIYIDNKTTAFGVVQGIRVIKTKENKYEQPVEREVAVIIPCNDVHIDHCSHCLPVSKVLVTN